MYKLILTSYPPTEDFFLHCLNGKFIPERAILLRGFY